MNRNEIKYLALQELGFVEFPDFDSEEDNAVNAINNQYEHIYSLCLQAFNWSFSERFTELQNPTEVDGKYKYKFDLPNDLLYLRGVYGDDKLSVIRDYKIVGEHLYSNEQTVFVSYTLKLCEEQLPSYFIEYLKFRLARQLCQNLTGDKDLLQTIYTSETVAFADAKNIDLTQRRVRVLPTGAFTDVRF